MMTESPNAHSHAEEYVIDATFFDEDDGMIVFCLTDREAGTVTVGLMLAQDREQSFDRGPVVGVHHSDGPEAVQRFIATHQELIERFIPAARGVSDER